MREFSGLIHSTFCVCRTIPLPYAISCFIICPIVGAVTGREEENEQFHEQTWFIVVVVLVGMIVVTFIILMLVCVVRSVRNNKSHEGKYNGK